MESLIDEASCELADQFSVDTVFSPAINAYSRKFEECSYATRAVSERRDEMAMKSDRLNDLLRALNDKQEQLEAAFSKIDKIEIIVNKVKDTYNAVAENLDTIEKAVTASTTAVTTNRSHHRQQQQSIPVQPYFPPPNHVDIFSTDELLASTSPSLSS